MTKPKKFAVGIVVSEHGLWGLKSWKPVVSEMTIAEAEALSEVLMNLSKSYVAESRREQALLEGFREIWKEGRTKK